MSRFTPPDSRALIEAKVVALRKQLEHNKSILLRPYSTIYSGFFLSFLLYQFLSRLNLFAGIRGALRHQNQIEAKEKTFLEFFSEVSTPKDIQKLMLEDGKTITKFETDLRDWLINWEKPDNVVVILRANGFPHATRDNFKLILAGIPNRLQDLVGLTGERHLIYYVAKLIDWASLYVAGARKFRDVFSTILNIVCFYISSTTPQLQLQLIPEYRGPGLTLEVHPNITNCTRYAQLIHLFGESYVLGFNFVNNSIDSQALTRADWQILLFSMGVALFTNLTMLTPLLKKITQRYTSLHMHNADFIQYMLPIGWFLDKPLQQKDHRLLELDELKAEEKSLRATLAKQAPYVRTAKKINFFLIFAIVASLLYLFSGPWSDLAYVALPILSALLINNVCTYSAAWLNSVTTARQLNILKENLTQILAPIASAYSLIENKEDGYLSIQVTQTYQSLPSKHIATTIKSVLNRYGVQITLYDQNSLVIIAGAYRQLLASQTIRDFFITLLNAFLIHYKLENQLKCLVNKLGYVDLEASFLNLTRPIWMLHTRSPYTQLSSNLQGVTVNPACIFIQRASVFSHQELTQLEKLLLSALPSASVLTEPYQVKAKKPRPFKFNKMEIKKISQAIPKSGSLPTIFWKKAGIASTDSGVSPIDNTHHRYMLFDLPLEAFGGEEKVRDHFKSKSTQMARNANNSQGIKHGHYLGEDYFLKRQQVYAARIKLAGESQGSQSNNGVLLSVESADTGELLYRTRSFATRIHS